MSPDGDPVFIKDGWRPDECAPEYSVLEHTKGIDGATQLLAYEARELTTSAIRAQGAERWDMEGFENRTSTRIVIAMCGKPVSFFKSQWQLFAAIRDAIAAHRELVNQRKVLHRDISPNNILLGAEDAPVGQRGVLADYDMAIQGERSLAQSPSDRKAGTLPYMSISVLASHRPNIACAPSHDQFDDLESFYCVSYDFMCLWEGVGQQVVCRPAELNFWNVDNDPVATYIIKLIRVCSGYSGLMLRG